MEENDCVQKYLICRVVWSEHQVKPKRSVFHSVHLSPCLSIWAHREAPSNPLVSIRLSLGDGACVSTGQLTISTSLGTGLQGDSQTVLGPSMLAPLHR